MHPFFNEIKSYPDLELVCRTDIIYLPAAFKGTAEIKAILLGADPTNDGIQSNKGLKILDTVFGIGSDFEKYFFAPQLINLNVIEVKKENLYIQNVCRNYFKEQTSENKKWEDVANIWLPYLKKELSFLDDNIPVFVTAERIMKLLVTKVPSAKDIYSFNNKFQFFSTDLNRKILPLYRHPSYALSNNRWPGYTKYLKQIIDE